MLIYLLEMQIIKLLFFFRLNENKTNIKKVKKNFIINIIFC